jgi:hypothetical protein
MKNIILLLLLFFSLDAYNQTFKEINDSLVTYSLRLNSDCDTSNLLLNNIENYPSSYEYLESNNYCYNINPPSNSITTAFTFYCTSSSAIIINAGYSVLSCSSIDFNSVLLYDNTTCEFVGEGFYFNLEEGHTYTWAITATASGVLCQGFSTICPYWLESNPLLIDLLIFQGEVHDKYIKLEWSTASETNSHYFIIEKSNGLNEFSDLVRVEANGTTSNINTYTAIDDNPIEGINYYRIKEVDYNGNEHYYYPIFVSYNSINNNIIKIIDINGRPVDIDTEGYKIIIYENGTIINRYIIH